MCDMAISFADAVGSWDDRFMALAVKGSRLITVDGALYRWRCRHRPTYSQESFDPPPTFTAELAASSGTVLEVAIPDVSHPGSLMGRSSLIVRPALVAAVIQTAFAQDGSPQSAASHCCFTWQAEIFRRRPKQRCAPKVPPSSAELCSTAGQRLGKG